MNSAIKIVGTVENSDLDEIAEIQRNDKSIKYIIDIATKEEDGYLETTHEDFDDMDLTRTTFNEVLLNLNTKECRPFLDCDGYLPGKKSHEKQPDAHIKTIEEYNKFIEWVEQSCLKKLKTSEYAIVGYTKDEQLAEKTGLRLNKQNNHFVSAHLHFPKVKVNCKDWVAWLKEEKRTGKCPFIDLDVYHDKRQIFRCGLCNKQTCGKIEQSRGQVVANYEGFKQSDLLITPKGDEKLVQIVVETEKAEQIDENLPDELVDNADILILNNDELLELFNCFEPRVQTGLEPHVCVSLSAPACYDVDDKLLNAILQWYNQVEHDNGDKPVYDHFHLYRRAEESNRWLFGLINHIEDESKRGMFKTKYLKMLNKVKDEKFEEVSTAKITSTTIKEIKQLEGDDKIQKVLSSVKFLVNHSAFLEFIDRSRPTVIKQKQLDDKLESCGFEEKEKKNVIKLIKRLAYLPDENLSFDLIFSGWKYDTNQQTDKYVKHIEGFNEALDNVFTTTETKSYFLRWVNYILHHPGKVSKIIVLIQGRQGTGKTFIGETIANLFKGYENKTGNMDDLTGRFNIQHFGKCIYVMPEIKNAADNERGVYDRLKSKATEETTRYEEKGITAFEGQNSLNIIGMSNNARPMLPDLDDRRLFNVKSSSEHANDKSYWSKFYELRDEQGFYENLCYYIKHLYPCNDEFLKLDIPQTREKIQLIKSGLNNLNKLIYEHFGMCQHGVSREEFKDLYKSGDYEQKESNMWNDFKNRCQAYKQHNVLYYHLTEEETNIFNQKVFDVMEQVEAEDDENDAGADFAEIIDSLKHETDKYYYILAKDINESNNKEILIKTLLSSGWVYSTKMREAGNKRGYKLIKTQSSESEPISEPEIEM